MLSILFGGRKRITKKCQRNLEKFRNTDFDYAKFVRKFYMEKGDAHISCTVNSINDIINSYSVRGYEWINKDFAAYIEECVLYVPVEYAIVLEIEGCTFTEEEQSVIRRVVDDYFGLQLCYRKIDIKQNLSRSLWLLGGGLSCLTLYILGSTVLDIGPFSEIILVLSWFAIWTFAERMTLRRRDLTDARTEAGQLYEMKIRFSGGTQEQPAPDASDSSENA